jgi:DUF4097 and DUF4098 domain-containing protein YvlB
MPTFDTPSPIDLAINLPVGFIDVVASDRTDTVVTVMPTNPSRAADVRGAEGTKVDFDGTRLTVTGPRPRPTWIGPSESIDLTILVPTASRLTADIAVGNVHATGRFGATRVKASVGSVELGETADLWVRASHGTVSVSSADATEIASAHGFVTVGTIAGDALIKSAHGGIRIGEARGELEAKLSYGDLDINAALSSVTVKTAYGNIRLGEVSTGSIQVESGYGQVSVGIRNGVAAWLDLASKIGHVRNHLDTDSAPTATQQTVAVRVRTQGGDITVQRAH